MFNWLIKRFSESSAPPAATTASNAANSSEKTEKTQVIAQTFRLKAHGFFDVQDWHNASQYYQKAMSYEPGLAADHYNLGYTLWELKQFDPAKSELIEALRLNATLDDAYYILGDIERNLENIDAAIQYFEKAVAIKQDFEEALSLLGALYTQQGNIEKAVECYEKAASINPQSENLYSNLLLSLQYQTSLTRAELFAKHQRFSDIFEAPFNQAHHSKFTPLSNKKLKVGYVSADFRKHSVALFMIPVLANHNKVKFETFCYYNHHDADEITQQIAKSSDHFIVCSELSDEELASRIKADQIDILIDLSGHTGGNRLLVFARKPAPIQVSYLGYIDTTGLKAIDYRLTNLDADPVGSDAYYSEKLYRFDQQLWWCYRPANNLPDVTELPALSNGFITFASANNIAKLSAQSISAWAEILNRTPNSKLILIGIPAGIAQQRINELFENDNISKTRLILHGRVNLDQYRSILLNADIALDSFPYNGGTTTCETLSLGLPLIALTGSSFVSRMGYALLKDIGLTELAASNIDEYIDIAVELAQNLGLLSSLRAGMRQRLAQSSLSNESMFTENLEKAYQEMWETYVNTCETPVD